MGEGGQPNPIEMLLDLLNPLPEKDCCVEGHRKCILDWTREEDPADKDDRLYHEGVDIEAIDRAIHNNPLGVGFAQKDKKGE